MDVMITVTEPVSGMSATWKALSKKSALKQAKSEAAAGAKVVITQGGRVIWSN